MTLSFNNLSKSEQDAVLGLNDAQLLAAYDIQNMKFRIEDAKSHAEDMGLENLFSEDDYNSMAEEFIDNYDCNVPENNIWENIVDDFAREKQRESEKM